MSYEINSRIFQGEDQSKQSTPIKIKFSSQHQKKKLLVFLQLISLQPELEKKPTETFKLSLDVLRIKNTKKEFIGMQLNSLPLKNDTKLNLSDTTVCVKNLEQSSTRKSEQFSRKMNSSANYSNEFDMISFLGSTLHNFKTNLNIINFTLENILSEQSQLETYKIVKSQTLIIGIYLNIFQDISRLSRSKNQITLNYEKFSLKYFLFQIQDHLQSLLKNKHIKFYVQQEIPGDLLLNSDEFRMKSLILILLENAIKFTNTGKIILTVFEGFNQSLSFQILDTGIGIPEEKYFLFEQPLDTLVSSNQNVNEIGMGIGLYYAKKLLKSMGPSDRINILNQKSQNSFKIEDGIGSIIEFTVYSDMSKMKFKTRSFNFLLFDDNSNNSDNVFQQEGVKKKRATIIQHTFEPSSPESALSSQSKQNFNSSSNITSFHQNQEQNNSNFEDLPDCCDDNLDFLSTQLHNNFPQPRFFQSSNQPQQSFLSILSPKQEQHKISNSNNIVTQFKKQGVYPFNILLVDDVAFNITILQTFIKNSQEFKFNTLEAYNGKEALDLFTQCNEKPSIKNIDIIIMDCDMPIMNGYESCFAIKSLILQKGFIGVKVIAFSCFQGEEQQILCERAKFDGVLEKPCTLQNFVKYIKRLILII